MISVLCTIVFVFVLYCATDCTRPIARPHSMCENCPPIAERKCCPRKQRARHFPSPGPVSGADFQDDNYWSFRDSAPNNRSNTFYLSHLMPTIWNQNQLIAQTKLGTIAESMVLISFGRLWSSARRLIGRVPNHLFCQEGGLVTFSPISDNFSEPAS